MSAIDNMPSPRAAAATSAPAGACSPGVESFSLPADRRPNLIGIGAPKSGTTFFTRMIGQHPDIFVPGQKELNVLMYRDLVERHPEYLAHFDDAGSAAYRCDFSVGYMTHPLAAPNAGALMPDAKIVALLRDPVDQIVSHYWHLRRQNFHQPTVMAWPPGILEAVERFPDHLLAPARYGAGLEAWLAHFPKDQVFVEAFETLTAAPQAVLERFCGYLGVPYAPDLFDVAAVSATERRSGVRPRGKAAALVYSWIYSTLAFGPYSWLKRRIGVRAADGLKRALKVREAMQTLFFKSGYEAIGERERTALRDMMADDGARLARLGVFDPAVWTPAQDRPPSGA